MVTIDVLMITYRWPSYVARTLPRLLETCDEDMRVWIWHNGDDAATLEVARSFATHDRVAAFHHSPVNQRLGAPTNWLWENSSGDYVGKVDDDCLVSDGWAHTLRQAHACEPRLGVVGSWRFPNEDFVPSVAETKITTIGGGHRLLQNPWVQGSGYLMKRRCVQELGPLQQGQSFTAYCIELAAAGYMNGWYFPFVREEHLDDPRSPYTGLRTEEDFQERFPLSARWRGISTLAQWEEENRRTAYSVQAARNDPRQYRGWRARLRRARSRARQRWGSGTRRPVRYSGTDIPRTPGVPSWDTWQAELQATASTEHEDRDVRR